jgi:hypothetical protein
MKQQQSPEKYITTRARTLPIYKCFVNSNWEESKMANVLVMRKHVNGNITMGMYLVDLFCLGVKDCDFTFNVPEAEVMERFDNLPFEEIEYALAHNIIFAGHDFAQEFHINPYKDFQVCKFILEEDNDNIPLIEIATGDANGNPVLMTDKGYTYKPIIEKLAKYAGEGNYHIAIHSSSGDEDWNDEDWEVEDEDDEENDDDTEDADWEEVDKNDGKTNK